MAEACSGDPLGKSGEDDETGGEQETGELRGGRDTITEGNGWVFVAHEDQIRSVIFGGLGIAVQE